MTKLMKVEVAYAAKEQQQVLALEVEEGSSIGAVIKLSGMLELFPEIHLEHQKVGVFSKLVSLDAIVQAGDRIEIYRPLTIDPKDARRAKAEKVAKPTKKSRPWIAK